MPQINNGKSPAWVSGEIVTASGLNQMIESATINPSIISDQPDNGVSNVFGSDLLLLLNSSSGQLNKVTTQNLFQSNLHLKTQSITNSTTTADLSVLSYRDTIINSTQQTLITGGNPTSARPSILIKSEGSTNGNVKIESEYGNVILSATAGSIMFQGAVSFSGTTNLIPTGVVFIFANSAVPAGWAICNGQAVSRTSSTFAALFAAIGTIYGVGDGVSTFNLPDLRGEFVRGWDEGRGVDTSRALGSKQQDQIEAHKHIASNNDCQNYAMVNGTGTGSYNAWCDTNGINSGAGAALTGDGTHPEQTNVGQETRPRNVAMRYCIKL